MIKKKKSQMYKMRANTDEGCPTDERLKEYQRQQERLKAMASNTQKVRPVSADAMIENLLKQNFVKPNITVDNKIYAGPDLPKWLDCESLLAPDAYGHLWSLVKTASNFADTQKVSQLLLTSGLQMEILGFIWNLSNRAVPGQLNKQEFYIVLALVGLAQSGYTFNNLSILNLIPTPPIPVLQTKELEKLVLTPCTTSSIYFNETSQFKVCNEEKLGLSKLLQNKYNDQSLLSTPVNITSSVNDHVKDSEIKIGKKPTKLNQCKELFDLDSSNKDISKASHFPFIGSSPTAELENDDEFSEFHSVSITESLHDNCKIKNEELMPSLQSDEFTDFQCADINVDPLETIVINQKREIPKIPLPRNFTGKLSNLRSNILKISPESEKKLKVLSQSEALSSLPESKISANNKVSTMPNISVLGGSRDVGMRLANHSIGFKTEKPKHQRHHKHKQQVHSDDFSPLKQGNVDEIFSKCFQKSSSNSKTFILKETKIRSVEANEHECQLKLGSENDLDLLQTGKNTRQIEIPMLGTINETTLPTQSKQVKNLQQNIELFSIEEDKYSALREVELEMKQNQQPESAVPSDGTDDFGEFLSAAISSASGGNEDVWGNWNNISSPTETNIQTVSEAKHSVKDLNNTLENIPKQCESDLITNNTLTLDLLSLKEQTNDMKTLDSLHLNDTEIFKSDTQETKMESLLSNAPSEPERTQTDETKILKSGNIMVLDDLGIGNGSLFPEISIEDQKIIQIDTNKSAEDFGEFFTSDYSSGMTYTLKRRDSLPSLDLKISHSEASDQESIRKRCLVACLNQIQQGEEILSGVSSKSVLEEIFSTREATDYLNNLNIIYHISRRITTNNGEVSSVQSDIEKLWKKLIMYCYEYNIQLNEDLDDIIEEGVQCNLCLGFIGNDCVEQGFSSYHPSCANFWLNCIDSALPYSV